MFSLEDEDEDDFNMKPEIGSKLANLFDNNDSKLDVDASNRTLIYTPPKQPKKFELNSSSSGDNVNNSNVMTLIHASAVNVFKFEGGKYVSRGKLGAALLGNHDTGSYKLILYTGRQQHIAFATIAPNFQFICQPNTYSSFYCDKRENWSLMFDTVDEKCNFNRQLTVFKFNAILKSENKSSFLTQDLILGNESSPIVTEENDNIELRYKGWIFEDNETAGKLFVDIDNTSKKRFRVKLSGKWTQMLNGMKIGGKRFVIIGPNMLDEMKDLLENAPIGQFNKYGFEFELIKIQSRTQQKKTQQKKTQQKFESNEQNETKEQKIPNNETEKVINSENTVHSRSRSDSNRESNETNKPKSDILSRMSRMGGLPILPVKPDPIASKPESVDTTDTTEDNDNNSKPFPKPRNSSITSNSSQSIDSNQRIIENNSYSQFIPQIPVSTMSTTSYSTPIPPYFMPQTVETNLSILTSETRSNNTEIRMNLSKILDKIDSVSEKVNEIKNCSTPSMNPMSMSNIGFMDSAIIMSSIQRIVNENNSLKKEVEEKTSSLQKLNEKICDLLQKTNSNHQNSQELDTLLMSESRLKRELIILNEECDRFRAKNDELTTENSRLRQTVKELKVELENRPNTSDRSKEFSNKIKKLMNDMFRKFNAQIDENKDYKSDEIIEIVSNSIRSATLSVIESQNNSRTNSPFRLPIDEIDRNKQNPSVVEKSSVKPPIPQRKTIETQHKIDKIENIPKNKELNKSNETSEETNEKEIN